jgi:hypothetical protein
MNNPVTPPLSAEDQSKDDFHNRLSSLCNAMIATHGSDFTVGTLVLAARFIVEGKPMVKADAPQTQPA